MSTSPLRAAMMPVSRQMRAYFAPVQRTTETPTIFDPGLGGVFPLNSPPTPWLDLGWIDNFARSYDTPTDVVRSGAKAMAAARPIPESAPVSNALRPASRPEPL